MAGTDRSPGNDFDPTAPAALADPHAMYRDLRVRCPVAHSTAHGGFWTVTRTVDIERVVTDPATFSSRFGIIVPRNPASGRRPPMHYDPPEHTVFRTAINPAFRKDRLARLEPIIRARAAELVASAVAACHGGDPFDAFDDLASPLCATSVGHLMNLPDDLRDTMTAHAASFEKAQFAFDAERVEAENLVLYDLSRQVVAARRREPLDPREDLVSGLLGLDLGGVLHGESGEPIEVDVDEVVAGSIRQILVAGHGAPALVLASAIGHLADDTDLQDLLRRSPERIGDAVEELLRLYTPNQGFARTTTRDVVLGDRPIAAGSVVTLPYTSANRDEAVFDRPDEVDLDRTERHLAFGLGVHVCPGSHVGRLQTRLALAELLGRTSRFERAGAAEWAPFPVYGPQRLPVRLRAPMAR